MKAGPKGAVDASELPFKAQPHAKPSTNFVKFCAQFIVVPKGTGARKSLRIRPWQKALVASVLDAKPQPRTAGWMLPRGQGKSTLVAALGLFELMLGGEGASVVVVAVDERQAGIVFGTARRMVEMHPELASRVQVYRDRLEVPARGATFMALPASPAALEGLDYSLAIADEVGVIRRDVWEVVSLAQGKRDKSTLIGIGTPGPDPEGSVLTDLRDYARAHPDDKSLVWREHSAAAFIDHPVNCKHCWALANPALGDFLHEDAMAALLPPKTREAVFRRARLCQFMTSHHNSFLPEGKWEALGTGELIEEGAEVVLALDGSFNSDATALLLATVSTTPHFQVLGLWEPPKDDPDYRVPIAEVEDVIRQAAKTYTVIEVVADPFRWTRTLQALAGEGLPIVEFPHSTARMTAATTDLYKSAIDGALTHDNNPDFARHIGNAVVVEDSRGVRLDKGKRGSVRHIDLAACAVMAHSRATWRATKKTKRRRARSFNN